MQQAQHQHAHPCECTWMPGDVVTSRSTQVNHAQYNQVDVGDGGRCPLDPWANERDGVRGGRYVREVGRDEGGLGRHVGYCPIYNLYIEQSNGLQVVPSVSE